jgi:2-oxoglutarate dehydrogenase E2 component (dihydrolipoamide succinyltransferase)
MVIDIVLPAEQSEGTESVVAAWFKRAGDAVAANEPLLEISTDKVTVEIAAPASGVLREILKPEGEKVELGEVLGRIAVDDGEKVEKGERGEKGEKGEQGKSARSAVVQEPLPELSPAVRRMLKEHGLEASAIRGTGTGGRISVQDVEAFLRGRPEGRMPSRRVPHTPMRKSIAEHMVRSVQAAPHVTSLFEADLSAVVAHRQAHQAEFLERGVRLTYTAYFLRATVAAVREVPQANARWHDDALEIWEDVNVGVATALEAGGLIVPVVPKAQDLDLFETTRVLQDLTERARAGTLEPKDVQRGTITISNHGVSGSLLATPIVINQPQSAIVGVGKVQKRPVAFSESGKDEVRVRPMVYLTLTIDHRVLDGYDANRFLSRFVEALERWQ